jgi:hypothetical protein
MTVALLLHVKAGIGQHVWDLTYPRVMAIGRWSMLLLVYILQNSTDEEQRISLPFFGPLNYFCSNTAYFAYIFAYSQIFG